MSLQFPSSEKLWLAESASEVFIFHMPECRQGRAAIQRGVGWGRTCIYFASNLCLTSGLISSLGDLG